MFAGYSLKVHFWYIQNQTKLKINIDLTKNRSSVVWFTRPTYKPLAYGRSYSRCSILKRFVKSIAIYTTSKVSISQTLTEIPIIHFRDTPSLIQLSNFQDHINRGSYTSGHVLSFLINELIKMIRCEPWRASYSFE